MALTDDPASINQFYNLLAFVDERAEQTLRLIFSDGADLACHLDEVNIIIRDVLPSSRIAYARPYMEKTPYAIDKDRAEMNTASPLILALPTYYSRLLLLASVGIEPEAGFYAEMTGG